jgi:two-component sensor histidine kinase
LRHRVRNLIAIISSIAARTGETAQSVPQYAEVLGSRLMALARTQSLLSNNSASAVNLASMIRDEVGAHAHHETDYEISGPDVFLPAKAAEVLGLAIHELATNALKYGALSEPDGRVSIHWSVADRDGEPCLTFDWNERRKNYVESPASRRGFGTELVERRVPYELHGTSRLTIDGNGAHCRIEFPLRDGASIFDSTPPR